MAGELVLIADDEPDILDLARYTLEMEGYRVQTVSDGQQAVELCQEHHFDLLLTDIKMPRLGGLAAFQQIREMSPTIVGVTMTGYGTMNTAIQALKIGFADFVVKPFTPDELAEAVGRALDKERLRRENVRLRALIPLFELSRAFVTTTDLPTLLRQVVQTGLRETQAEYAICLLIASDDTFEVAATAGQAPPTATEENFARLADWVRRTGQSLVLDTSEGMQSFAPNAGIHAVGSLLALPLISKDEVIGVLIMEKAPGVPPFSESEAELLGVLAGQAAVAIENARLFREIERAYGELKQIDYLKSEFINIAAHELRTPLSLVLGYAGLLEGTLPPPHDEYLQSILDNGMRLQTIVDDMLNLRYLEIQQVDLTPQRLALRETVEAAVAAFRPMADSKQVSLDITIPTELAVIEADPQKLELILGNLLSNAIKYSPPGGIVSITAEPLTTTATDEVVIAIGDSGPGVPLPERAKIFERFYQTEASLTRRHGGLGLGLAIVRGLVELHGGRVWVEDHPGGGSLFKFTIPRHLI